MNAKDKVATVTDTVVVDILVCTIPALLVQIESTIDLDADIHDKK